MLRMSRAKLKRVKHRHLCFKADILIELVAAAFAVTMHRTNFFIYRLIALAVEEGVPVEGLRADSRVHLRQHAKVNWLQATRMAFKRKAATLNGKKRSDDARSRATSFMKDAVEIGPAAVILPRCSICAEKTKIGSYSCIREWLRIVDSVIAENATRQIWMLQ